MSGNRIKNERGKERTCVEHEYISEDIGGLHREGAPNLLLFLSLVLSIPALFITDADVQFN